MRWVVGNMHFELRYFFCRREPCLVTPDLRIVEEDPDDDKFIEGAVALNAEVVISGDKALRAIEKYMGIQIVTPREFLETFKKKSQG
jgi:hypothetical protein